LFISFSALPLLASADWFLSAETKALIVKAEAGDADAQIRVALAYDSGRGAPRDRDNAIKWYRMAADAGNAEAQNSLGSMFQENKEYKDALFWYEKAASQGNARATNSEAYLYDLGLGVPQDRARSFELYSQAADLGCPKQCGISQMSMVPANLERWMSAWLVFGSSGHHGLSGRRIDDFRLIFLRSFQNWSADSHQMTLLHAGNRERLGPRHR